jgi:hypothetical protein
MFTFAAFCGFRALHSERAKVIISDIHNSADVFCKDPGNVPSLFL